MIVHLSRDVTKMLQGFLTPVMQDSELILPTPISL